MEWPFKYSLGSVSSLLRKKCLILERKCCIKDKSNVEVGQAYHLHGKQAYNSTRMRFWDVIVTTQPINQTTQKIFFFTTKASPVLYDIAI